MAANLSEQDYQELMQGLLRLHAERDVERLPRVMLDIVQKLIPCEHLSYNELNPRQKRAMSFFSTRQESIVLGKYLPAFEQHMEEHAVLKHYQQSWSLGKPLNVQTMFDFLPRAEFQRTGLYGECFRYLDTEFQLIICIDMGQDRAVGIALSRKLMDFTERDRQVAEAVRPHLSYAYRNAMRRLSLRRLFDPDGEQKSVELLQKLDLTPREAQVLFWLIQGKTSPQISTILEAKPRTIDKHLEHLFVKLGVETRSAAIMQTIDRLEI